MYLTGCERSRASLIRSFGLIIALSYGGTLILICDLCTHEFVIYVYGDC